MEINFIHISVEEPKPKFTMITDAEVWGKTISDHAKKGAALGIDCGRMCSDCAFKFDQPHTVDYQEAVDGAVLMLVSAGKFHCHTTDENGMYADANKPCAGFAYAQLFFDSRPDDE